RRAVPDVEAAVGDGDGLARGRDLPGEGERPLDVVVVDLGDRNRARRRGVGVGGVEGGQVGGATEDVVGRVVAEGIGAGADGSAADGRDGEGHRGDLRADGGAADGEGAVARGGDHVGGRVGGVPRGAA